MSKLQWDDSKYSLKIAAMDTEHKELINKMNALYDANDRKLPKEKVMTLLNDLAQFVVKHFADEEAYMESIQFPSIEGHKAIHKALLKKVNEFAAQISAGDGKLPPAFIRFLNEWLTSHIQGIDMKYSEHAHSSKGKAA